MIISFSFTKLSTTFYSRFTKGSLHLLGRKKTRKWMDVGIELKLNKDDLAALILALNSHLLV